MLSKSSSSIIEEEKQAAENTNRSGSDILGDIPSYRDKLHLNIQSPLLQDLDRITEEDPSGNASTPFKMVNLAFPFKLELRKKSSDDQLLRKISTIDQIES